MSRAPTISVAMATFNGARHLEVQLDSIAAQTRLPDELVIGDDGSTDATADIVARYARTAPFEVRFTRNETRLGSSQNFVSCLERCRGDVVLLSDQDDAWYPSRAQRTTEALEAHGDAAYAFSDADLMDEAGRALPGRLWQKAFFGAPGRRAFSERRGVDVLLKTNVVTGATMAIRRDAIRAALPIPSGWVHDGWLAFLLEVQFGAVPIDEPLVRYRLHASQQIGVLRMAPMALVAVARRQDAAFLRREAGNFRALAARVADLDVPAAAEIARRALGKATCLESRAAFRDAPARVAGGFLRSVLRGDYDEFGLGKKQAAFDVFGALVARLPRRSGPSSAPGR